MHCTSKYSRSRLTCANADIRVYVRHQHKSKKIMDTNLLLHVLCVKMFICFSQTFNNVFLLWVSKLKKRPQSGDLIELNVIAPYTNGLN